MKCRVALKEGWEYRFGKTKAFDVTCDKYWKRWMWVLCVDYRYRMTGLRQISVYKVHRRESYDCNRWFQSHHTRIFLNRYFHTNQVKYNKKLWVQSTGAIVMLSLWRRQQCKTARVRTWMAIVVVSRKWISRNTRELLFRSLFSKYKLLINYMLNSRHWISPKRSLPELNKQSTTSPLPHSLTITVSDCGRAPFGRYHRYLNSSIPIPDFSYGSLRYGVHK